MVLDNSGGLFRSTGLEQETGILAERWGQTGSSLINLYSLVNATGTLYTVTAGKVFYVSQIIVQEGGTGSAGDTLTIRDNTTNKLVIDLNHPVNDFNGVYNFASPLKFETDVNFVEGGGIQANVTITGWEE